MSRAAASSGVLLLSLAAVACASLTELAPGIAFIDIRGPSPAVVPVGGSITLTAIALSASEDTVAATFDWASPDTLLVRVDRSSGTVTGRQVGTARVQAQTGDAVSAFFSLTVIPSAAP